MGTIKNSLNKQIEDKARIKFSDTTGTILEYDKTTNTCKVKYTNPNGEGYIYRSNVQIVNTTGGLFNGGIAAGQQCSISFINDNIYCPVIRGIQKSFYTEQNSPDQGAYIADDEVWKVGTPENIIAMNLDWIDDDNNSLSVYEANGARYTDVNVEEKALALITSLDKYEDDEIGLTNLDTKSTVKLKENGDIDIFTRANTGMRICKSGNIKFYATDIEFTGNKEDSEKTDRSISTQLKNAQIMKICLTYDIIKETDQYVDLLNEAIANSTELNGDKS